MAIGSKVKRVQASNPTDNTNTRKWIYRIKYDKIALNLFLNEILYISKMDLNFESKTFF
jgi:hypothetical protein